MKTAIAIWISLMAFTNFAWAGSAEHRRGIACGIATSATEFHALYWIPADGIEDNNPAVDGEADFEVDNIQLVTGHKYCIQGDYNIPMTDPGILDAEKTYLQH